MFEPEWFPDTYILAQAIYCKETGWLFLNKLKMIIINRKWYR